MPSPVGQSELMWRGCKKVMSAGLLSMLLQPSALAQQYPALPNLQTGNVQFPSATQAAGTQAAGSPAPAAMPQVGAYGQPALQSGPRSMPNAVQSPQRTAPPAQQPTSQQPGSQQSTNQQAPTARLQTYNVPSNLVGAIGAQLQVQYHNDPAVSVTTDPQTGQLMIMAPDAVHKFIGAEITKFMQQNNIAPGDRGMNVASTQQSSYSLRNLSWRELEDALQRLGGPRLTITTERNGELAVFRLTNPSGFEDILQIDRRRNVVHILGHGAAVAGWNQVIFSLDNGQADGRNSTHVVPLAPAEPRKVKRAIQLVKATVQEQEASGDQVQAQVELGADDQATAMGSLETLSTDSGLFGDVQIEFIEEIDLVIIRGSKRDVQRTLEVIEQIKKQAEETQPEIEVYVLAHANAEAVADLVTNLYDDIYAPRQGAISITPLGQPNALLLIGRAQVLLSVKELIEKIDTPLKGEDQLKVIRLLHASSVDVEARVRDFFTQEPGGDGGPRVGLGTRVKVLADYRTNSLIVQAAPREMIEVEKLITELDVEGTEAQLAVQVFKLKNTLSDDLQAVIEEVITGQGEGQDTSQAQPPSGRLSIISPSGPIESGILAGVVVTSDPSTNALVVRAPAQSMALIGQLIEQLDALPSAEARIKVFTIKNGDATQLSQVLQQLYGLQVTAGQSTTGGLFGLGTLQQAAISADGDSSLVQLRITPEVRTNSIIVSGGQSDLNVIEALLYRLDEEGIETRRTEVIWLRNATAQFVQQAIDGYLQQQRQVNQLLVTTNQAISVFDQAAREVFITAEAQTNSLILSATPRYFETVREVIDRLDRRPPLIAIQVLIAEVLLTDGFELGAEWGLQDGLLFDRGSATQGTLQSPVFNVPLVPPVLSGQDIATQGLSSFAMGRSNTEGLGGLVLSASSESVGVLVRALQTAGRLQVLNRPQITTLDSQPAQTLVGQLVPRVQGVTQAQFGQTVDSQDVEVGLGLAVLPRVNQDGLIVMQVQIQNSSLDETTPGIPVGFGPDGGVINSPIINTIQADTTVSAYSGQTVVFAGLIGKERTSIRRQIPILGSIPWIGAAFRYDQESEERRELLVVLTPRIIQNDEDFEALKQIESSRMSWCLADILNMHGDVGLQGGNGLWGPPQSPLIYPDEQPTVLDKEARPNSGAPPYGMPGMYEEVFTPMETIIEPALPQTIPLGTPTSQDDSQPSPFRYASSNASAAAGSTTERPALPTTGGTTVQGLPTPEQISQEILRSAKASGAQQGAYR